MSSFVARMPAPRVHSGVHTRCHLWLWKEEGFLPQPCVGPQGSVVQEVSTSSETGRWAVDVKRLAEPLMVPRALQLLVGADLSSRSAIHFLPCSLCLSWGLGTRLPAWGLWG